MINETTIYDAVWFTGSALILMLIAFMFGSQRRRGLLPMVVVSLTGLLILWGSQYVPHLLDSKLTAVLIREVALALVAFGFMRVALVFVLQTLLARRNIPRILDDLLITLAIVAYAIYRLNAIGVNLAGLITTSAVLTAGLAFSAQATLNNLWGGLSLQLEKNCRIGDWVRFDDVIGQVVQIRWRYMAVATNNNETIVIPNSHLMNNRLVMLARRGEERSTWRRVVPFNVEYEHSPSRVLADIEKALESAEIPNVAKEPRPFVICQKFDDSGINYGVAYFIIDPQRDLWTDSQVRTHVFAALARAGFGIPFPRRVVEMRSDVRPELAEREHKERLTALAASDLFASLTTDEREALTHELTRWLYAGDDVVFRGGDAADSLYLLARGRVHVEREDQRTKARHRLATLSAPSYFGEMGLLLGQPRGATVIADGDALCYRLDKRGFDAILHGRPQLAETLANVLAERQAANDATLQALDAEARAKQAVSRAGDLVRRIQQFFGLAGNR